MLGVSFFIVKYTINSRKLVALFQRVILILLSLLFYFLLFMLYLYNIFIKYICENVLWCNSR